MNPLVVVAVGATALLSASLGVIVGHGAATSEHVGEGWLRPCVSEDELRGPCWWDARSRGNGEGTSFVVLSDGSLRYLVGAEWRGW